LIRLLKNRVFTTIWYNFILLKAATIWWFIFDLVATLQVLKYRIYRFWTSFLIIFFMFLQPTGFELPFFIIFFMFLRHVFEFVCYERQFFIIIWFWMVLFIAYSLVVSLCWSTFFALVNLESRIISLYSLSIMK